MIIYLKYTYGYLSLPHLSDFMDIFSWIHPLG